MYKIEIKGEARASHEDLAALDGIDCQDNFVDYFDDEEENGTIGEALQSGYLNFKYLDNKLWAITEYESSRMLKEDELQELMKYTQGQWSDGIGEGFEQQSCLEIEDEEVFISAWYPGQELQVKQEEIIN